MRPTCSCYICSQDACPCKTLRVCMTLASGVDTSSITFLLLAGPCWDMSYVSLPMGVLQDAWVQALKYKLR